MKIVDLDLDLTHENALELWAQQVLPILNYWSSLLTT